MDMNSKIRFGFLLAGLVGLSNLAFAQTVDQGKKFYYYQRYKSAKDALEKALASNPNNIDAVYWLAETLLQMKDSVAAEGVLQKALQTNGNAPLLLVGMGHIELRKGKGTDARQRFETAISLTKGKDVEIFNAIGRANADAKANAGDPAYAIEKLNLATEIKKFNSPETYVIMGDAYRKLIDGGNAVTAYNKALGLDPKMAEAKFKIGIIYLTQNNKDYFLPAFDDAITMDPNYAPAIYQLYLYWFQRDINKAKEYFDKYLAVADADPSNDYDRTSIVYATGKYHPEAYDQAITAAKGYISTLGDKADPRYYKLLAYTYFEGKNDSVSAKSYLDQYFAKQKPEDFVPKDYSFRAEVLSKFPGNDSLVSINYQLAIAADTVLKDKMDLEKEAEDLFKKTGNKHAYAYWAGQMYLLNKNPVQGDIYGWGIANYQAGNFKTSDSIFCGIYIPKYPAEIFGYLWCARSKHAEDDSLNSGGLAVDAYEKLAQVGRALDSTAKAANGTDSIKYRSQILEAYFYLASYYNDVKKDKQSAIYNLQRVMEVDPSNPNASKFIEILKKPARPAARPKSAAAGGTKPSTGGK
jgi:cytochrome c-type biogenesis protein CcmH/NrfG